MIRQALGYHRWWETTRTQPSWNSIKKNQIEINGTVQEEMDPRPECIWRVGGNWPQDSLPIKWRKIRGGKRKDQTRRTWKTEKAGDIKQISKGGGYNNNNNQERQRNRRERGIETTVDSVVVWVPPVGSHFARIGAPSRDLVPLTLCTRTWRTHVSSELDNLFRLVLQPLFPLPSHPPTPRADSHRLVPRHSSIVLL